MASNRIPIKGLVTIRVFEGSDLVQTITQPNKVVLRGRNAVLFLLAQASGTTLSDYKLVKLVPGMNSTPVTLADQNVLAPIAEAKHIVLTESSLSLNEAGNSLIVTGTLPSGDGSGEVLTEAGLLLGNGQLFARMVHSATLPWNGSRSISYTWTIRVTS